jgi:hypothetical protein
LKLLGNREPDRLQIKLHSAHGTVPVLGLQRSFPAAVGDFKQRPADQAEYHHSTKQDREGVPVGAAPGSSEPEISAS